MVTQFRGVGIFESVGVLTRKGSEQTGMTSSIPAERVRDYPKFRLGGDPQTVPETEIAADCFGPVANLGVTPGRGPWW